MGAQPPTGALPSQMSAIHLWTTAVSINDIYTKIRTFAGFFCFYHGKNFLFPPREPQEYAMKKTTFKKIVPYNLRRLVPMLGLATATLFTACDKDDEIIPTRDVEIPFSKTDESQATYFHIQQAAAQPDVRYVYLVPHGSWETSQIHNIQYLRNYWLEPRLQVSEKVRGRGNFSFKPGEASQIPYDSIWYVNHGWTINAQLQNQK